LPHRRDTVVAVTHEPRLRPDEQEYRTEQASPDVAPSGDPLEPESAAPGTDARPWLIVGLVLLAIFAGLLLYAVVLPALR
jgi:hypothetical protein